MHWNKLPNIWSKRIELHYKVLPRVKYFRPVRFDFGQAAQKCQIKLHYQDSSSQQRVLTCTVAEAIQRFLRPGTWIVPRSIPVTVYNALERTTREPVDYRNHKPYAAILEYDLVHLNPDLNMILEMTQKRGPQMFLLDCLPDFPERDRAVVSKAFAALSTGKTSTFAITSRYKFKRPRKKQGIDQIEAMLAVEFAGSAEQSGTSDLETDALIQQKSLPDIGDMNGADIESQESSQHEFNIRSNATESEEISQQGELASPEADNPNQKALVECLVYDQMSREEQDWQLRLLSNRKPLPRSDSRAKLENSIKESKLNSESYNSGNELYSSRYSGRSLTTAVSAEDDSSIIDVNDHTNTLKDLEAIDKDVTRMNLTDESREGSDDAGSETVTTELQSEEPVIHITEPFGKQIMDATLALSRHKGRLHRPSRGSYRILCWASKYMPHLWPSVIQACMPPGCKIDMGPRSDRGSIQYVISPPIDSAVNSMLHDAELRESDDWI